MAAPKSNPTFVRFLNAAILLAFAVAIIVAIAPWNAGTNADPDYRGLNLFSYFTVQSNFIAAFTFVLAAGALVFNQRFGSWFGMLRGAAVLYMTVTGLVYTLLLQNNPDVHAVLGFNWKNLILHQLMPMLIVAEWLLWPPRNPISSRQSLVWLVFPIAWLVYTFARAALIGWYPYPFLNPALAGGMAGVTMYVIGITLGFTLLCLGVAWVSRERIRGHVGAS